MTFIEVPNNIMLPILLISIRTMLNNMTPVKTIFFAILDPKLKFENLVFF